MKSVYTNQEVASQLHIDVKTVAAIGRDILFVPRGGIVICGLCGISRS